jgi:CxxC-x17-CxxC domain-containing protein
MIRSTASRVKRSAIKVRDCKLRRELNAASAEQGRQFRLNPLKEELCSAGHVFSRGKFQNYSEGRMDFVDKGLKCIDRGPEFTFSAAEQLFFHDEQFKNDPKRCRQCRTRRNSRPRKPLRPETKCAECGSGTTVPFTPNQGSPVLCRPCFQKEQSQTDPAALQNVQSASGRLACVVIPFRAAKRKFFVSM